MSISNSLPYPPPFSALSSRNSLLMLGKQLYQMMIGFLNSKMKRQVWNNFLTLITVRFVSGRVTLCQKEASVARSRPC
jgi:hypothetical protein